MNLMKYNQLTNKLLTSSITRQTLFVIKESQLGSFSGFTTDLVSLTFPPILEGTNATPTMSRGIGNLIR